MGHRDYRVLSSAGAVAERDSVLHLVREDAEASLCGIPRSALDDPVLDQLVCSDCVDWLHRRRMVSGQ
ncbi:MAG TPA: hypothetical protein VGE99_02680, partial [Candidatus Dormibacteraeota bacterium]